MKLIDLLRAGSSVAEKLPELVQLEEQLVAEVHTIVQDAYQARAIVARILALLLEGSRGPVDKRAA